VATVLVVVGQSVLKGDGLLTIEAMKMETSITADQDGIIKAIHITPGSQIDAKDLLIEFE
jgi:pyruvate carboxylase